MIRRVGIIILLALLLALTGSVFSSHGVWRSFQSALFLIALIYLMAGGTLLVLKGGMFNGILFSFRQFYKRTSKLEEYVGQQTKTINKTVKKDGLTFSLTAPLLYSGVIIFIASLIGSIV
ncbi:DUF3899 domain-containing protein [Bacillus rubiinfantis]|uniref:DUF3899 domain-containing protein n=1 Tax=Bacillus rubiinfantis TaxID=1499680 RepID=UPI0005A8C1FA|nr:DUF3899 domain-containing protein [Bacillus rubiinfantis]